jgi:uncharacterized protein (TIRG00374 family)
MKSLMNRVRRFFTTALKVCISATLIYLLLKRIGVSNLVNRLVSANWQLLILSIFVFSLSNLFGSYQWYLLLKSKNIRISLPQVMAYYHVGLFFNNFLIGYVGGDAFRIYDIRRGFSDTTNAFATVFFDRIVGFFALSSLAMIVSLFWLQKFESTMIIVTTIVVLCGWVFCLIILFRESMAKKMSWLFKLFLPRFLHDKGRELYYGINQFGYNKILLLQLLFVSVLVQALRILTHFFAARAVGVQASPGYFFIFIPIVALAASLPISVGGIGIREQSCVTLFNQVGIPSAKVAAFEFLAYLIGIFATVPGGIIFALRRESTVRTQQVENRADQRIHERK